MKQFTSCIFLIVAISLLLCSCRETLNCDLVIKNVSVFNSKTEAVIENQTILINADTIVAIVNTNTNVKANKTIEGLVDWLLLVSLIHIFI